MQPLIRKRYPILCRFWSFNEAVLRQIQHRYLPEGKQQSLVNLSAKDQNAENGWSNMMTLILTGVSEILFEKANQLAKFCRTD